MGSITDVVNLLNMKKKAIYESGRRKKRTGQT